MRKFLNLSLVVLVISLISVGFAIVIYDSKCRTTDVYFTLKDVKSGLIIIDTVIVNTYEYDLLTNNSVVLDVVDGEIEAAKKIGDYDVVLVKNSAERDNFIKLKEDLSNLLFIIMVFIAINLLIFQMSIKYEGTHE